MRKTGAPNNGSLQWVTQRRDSHKEAIELQTTQLPRVTLKPQGRGHLSSSGLTEATGQQTVC